MPSTAAISHAAGLDVIEREPLDYERLRNHPRVLLTPHTAFYSVEGYTELRTKTAEEVRRILLGEAAAESGEFGCAHVDLPSRMPHRHSKWHPC